MVFNILTSQIHKKKPMHLADVKCYQKKTLVQHLLSKIIFFCRYLINIVIQICVSGYVSYTGCPKKFLLCQDIKLFLLNSECIFLSNKRIKNDLIQNKKVKSHILRITGRFFFEPTEIIL